LPRLLLEKKRLESWLPNRHKKVRIHNRLQGRKHSTLKEFRLTNETEEQMPLFKSFYIRLKMNS
jgi:hypothetical protein